MPFLLLLFLTLACLPDEWPAPWGPIALPGRAAALTWGGVALVIGLAWAIAFVTRRQLIQDPSERDSVIRRYSRWRFYHTLVQMAVYGLSLYAFGWGWAVQQYAGVGAAEWPGSELLILAPFFCSLVHSWIAFYDAERALHGEDEAFWSRGSYVLFHVRQNVALVLVPLLLLLLMKGVRRLIPDTEELSLLVSLGGMGLSLVAFVCMPWVLRWVLGLERLPDGPLRERLVATSQRLNFRCSDILVWNTRNGVANAMIAGLLPQIRYVFLSDRLLADLTPDEVEAVFGHEAGHVKHRHMLYYLAFFLMSLAVLWAFWGTLALHIAFLRDLGTALQVLPLVAVLGVYIVLVFGFLSRRCERQADVYGCRAVSCLDPSCQGHGEGVELAADGRGLCPTGIRTFIDALEKVARLNGISRDRPGWLQSWMHSTIARRVEFLQGVLADPSLEPRFQRRVALVKWLLFLGLIAALVGLMSLPVAGPTEGEAAPPTAGLMPPHTAERTAPSE